MRLDRKLNLVIPVERDGGATIYVHAMPISRETFDSYFLPLSRLWVALQEFGVAAAGQKIAMKMLLKVSADMGMLDDVQKGLIPEIRRLSNVVQPGANGWETIPLQEALNRKTFDPADAEEVENGIAFFMVLAVMAPQLLRLTEENGAANPSGARIVSSDCTAFAASLPI